MKAFYSRRPADRIEMAKEPNHSLVVVCSILLAGLILSIVLLAAVPPVSRDALIHHLAVPKLYLKHGGMYEIGGIVFSYYPMNLELLYMIPLAIGNDIAPKYIHFGFALLTAGLIFNYLRKRIDKLHGMIGALLFLSLPIIVKLSITAYVDLGLAFFSTAALLLIFKWADSNFKSRWLVAAGLCCGLALGTKYNGLVVLMLLSAAVPFVYLRWNPKAKTGQWAALGYGLLFAAIALAVFTPWMVRNYLWTYNPFFPLFDGWFNPKVGAGAAAVSMGHFNVRHIVYKENWWEIVLLPIRIFFQGEDGNPKYFDGRLNPYLFFLPLAAMIGKSTRVWRNFSIEKSILFAFTIIYMVFSFFSAVIRVRYFVPVLPALVILSVFGIYRIEQWIVSFNPLLRKQSTWAILVAMTVLIGLNIVYITNQFHVVAPFDYLSGKQDRDMYIAKNRPEYWSIKYANEHLVNAQVLGIFIGKRIYYSDLPMSTDLSIFKQAVDSADSAKGVQQNLQKKGITHLLVGHAGFNSWCSFSFPNSAKIKLRQFLDNQTEKLYSKEGYGIYALRIPAEAEMYDRSADLVRGSTTSELID